MVDVIPAVLPKNFKDLGEHLARVRGGAKLIQVDVVDGIFARNRTWPYRDRATFEKVVAEEHGLPLWDEFDFQFDLMIENPHAQIMDFVRAGASQVVVHAKAQGALEALQKLIELREEGGAFSVSVGIALPPTAQPEDLEPFEAQFDFVQVMGIARVGFQGEPFERRAIFLLERLRRRYPELTLQVDGAVTIENARALAKAGANRLVVGHDVWDAKDPKQEIENLKKEANQA